MNEFIDRVAVITGAASGIGRSIALRAAAEGMGVVVADIEAAPLAAVERELQALGAPTLAVVVDVSQAPQVESLARATMEHFGRVDLLVNNAGVGAGSTIWESSVEDWAWVLGINLWGVIHGLRSFVPLMLAQGTDAHIVNTASMAGLVSFHPSAPYHVSKHAVVALTEQLLISLKLQGAPVGASVLCPGMVRTRILESERNRPSWAGSAGGANAARDVLLGRSANPTLAAMMAQALAAEIGPEEVAERTFAAIRGGQLYILTHPELTQPVHDRAAAILRAAQAR